MERYLNIKYMLKRLEFATDAAMKTIYTSHTPYPNKLTEAMSTLKEAYNKKMTSVMFMTGSAMSPTLNSKYIKDKESVDRLLLRELPYPSPRHLNINDIIAFHSPYRIGDTNFILVRRIAALPGTQMITDANNLEPFIIPYGHCWVLADNKEMEPPDVLDSRFFGPLPFQNIIGRIMYNGYNPLDHGRVKNSYQAMLDDEPVLNSEFNIKDFFSD